MTAALIAGNVSCSQPAGGNTYVPDGGYNGGNGDQTGDDKEQGGNGGQTGGNEQGGTIGGGTGTGGNENPDPGKDPEEEENKYPDYYIDEEFGGQQFVEYGTRWGNTSNGDFTACYDNAKKFLADKVTDLQNDLNGQTNNQYYNMINTALQKYNSQQNNISNDINTNYNALAPFFHAVTDEKTNILSDEQFYDYKVSYYKLAHNAYQNSLSSLSKNTTLSVNRDMMCEKFPDNFFAQELANSNYNYNDLTLNKAKEVMNNTLAIISKKTNTNTAILKKVVELVLYNESLYGLNDFAKVEKVNNQTLRYEHGIDDFFIDYVEKQNNLNNIQNIDDGRTM